MATPPAKSIVNNIDLVSRIIHGVANSSNDLLSVALSSHLLSSIALDHLWRDLPTVYHILMLLPGFTLVDDKYSMTRWLQADDWEAFDQYSPRIRKISRLFTSSVHSTSYDIDFDIFQTLHRYRPGILLFPSLRTLLMPMDLPDIVSYELALLPLISPSLRTLEFLALNSLSSRYLERLVDLSRSSWPQVRHIRIYGRSAFVASKAVIHFGHLEYLDINFHHSQSHLYIQPGYSYLLNELSKLESLTSLLISPPIVLVSTLLLQNGFRHLKRLAMTGGTVAFAAVCRMTPHIEYLVLDVCQPEKIIAWKTFFHTLRASCPLLKDIIIYGKFLIREMPISVVEFLEPLFELSLRVVCVRSDAERPIGVYLSDADVSTIAGIWPDLLALEIFPHGRYVSPNIPTLNGVKAALMICDDLRYLVMSCWNEMVDLSSDSRQVSEITLDNTYPPFITFD